MPMLNADLQGAGPVQCQCNASAGGRVFGVEVNAGKVRYLIWVTGCDDPNTLRVALVLDGKVRRSKSARRTVQVQAARLD